MPDTDILSLPRWNELPPMDLYLDQMLQFVNTSIGKYFEGFGQANHPIITGTMVNNYVKLEFIKPPVKKRYDRSAVASLLVIALLKSIFTMDEISRLIHRAVTETEPSRSYDSFCDKLEYAVSDVFGNNAVGISNAKNDPADPRRICLNACYSFAAQYYIKKIFLNSAM